MLDFHLAELYCVETKYLNRAVKRNISRFPESFMFQLEHKEFEKLRFQFGTSSEHGGRRYLPFVFTEQGVAMLSAILNSETAINTSILIMEAFVEMRNFLQNYSEVFCRLEKIENKQLDADCKIKILFDAMKKYELNPKQGIFYDGQIFDAWEFVSNLVRKAKRKIILIDNFIDDTTLSLLTKKPNSIKVEIFTKTIPQQLKIDAEKFNAQYGNLELHKFDKSHDRFLIIDDDIYHIGASLKDLGKKWFAFSKMDASCINILEKLKNE